MKKRWLTSLAALILGNGLATAQVSYLPPPQTQVLMPESVDQKAQDNRTAQQRIVAAQAADRKTAAAPSVWSASAGSVPAGEASCENGWSALNGAKQRERVWVNAEYLVWWLTDNRVPPLIGTLPAALAAQNPTSLPAGAITTIFGGDNLDFHDFEGGRFTAGVWLDTDQVIGLEGSFFFLNRNSLSFAGSSTGDPVVGPVFFDVTAGKESIIVPVNPSQATETAHAFSTERLWGTELSLKSRLCYFSDSPFDILAGFRYMDLQNDLAVNSAIDFTGSGTRAYNDFFSAKNQFYGGQIGAAFNLREGAWSLGVTGKLGIGDVHETMVINGYTTEAPIGLPTQTFRGGILTAPSNIGVYSIDRFALLPEMTFTLGYQVTGNIRVTISYNFLYLSKAIYPGEAIDGVNPANIRGLVVENPSSVVRPIPIISQADLWAQGLNFGAEIQF